MLEDKLPIGRIAFAKSACIDWISEHSKTVLISIVSILVLSQIIVCGAVLMVFQFIG